MVIHVIGPMNAAIVAMEVSYGDGDDPDSSIVTAVSAGRTSEEKNRMRGQTRRKKTGKSIFASFMFVVHGCGIVVLCKDMPVFVSMG